MTRGKKIFISLFIFFNFLIMARVHIPLDSKFWSTFYRPVDAYLSFFSIYQDWMMFAANPTRMNIYISARVKFEDGIEDEYIFPDSSRMSLGEKYRRGERFRKLISETISREENRFMWPDVAKFSLRKLRKRHFTRIPVRVELFQHWRKTPDLKQEFIPHLTKFKLYSTFKFYTHEVN
jgi:hypothetical protein